MAVTGVLGVKDQRALTYGISRLGPMYRVGERMASLGIDTSRRPYISFDDGAATHNVMMFGTGDDELMYWDGTNFLITGATEVTGVVKIVNQELNVGTFASVVGSGIPLDGNTAVFRAYGDDDATTDLTGSRRVILGRMLYTIDQDGGHTMRGVQGQLKALDGIDFDSANNVVSGVEGYIELAGTGARTLDGRLIGCRAALEEGASGTTTIDATGIYAGFEATLNSTRTYSNSGVFAAFTCNISGGTTEWANGLYTNGCVTGVNLAGAMTTGMLIAGATTTAVSITGNATTGIALATGTFTTGISLAGTLTTGITIGACTTPLKITGASTQVLDFTDNTTSVIEDNKAAPDKAGSITIVTPAGATAYINYYDGTRA